MRRGLTAIVLFLLLALVGMDAWLVGRRARYRAETERLRGSMTELERDRADAIVRREEHTLRTAIELVRRQAKIEPALHLSVTVDSGAMYLEREGAMLRAMPVQVGPERRIGQAPDTVQLAAPRGVRVVARVLTDTARWEIPGWVYADRGEPVPPSRVVSGALGPVALLLDGGTVVYSMPVAGPLADSGYVLPGSVRARQEDLRAILPNLHPGMRVYFY